MSNNSPNSTKPNNLRVKTNLKAGAPYYDGRSAQHNQTVARGLKVRSSVKAGGEGQNHSQTVARPAKGLRIKTNVKAGVLCRYCSANHNQTVAHAAKGLRVKSKVKAGISWGGSTMRS